MSWKEDVLALTALYLIVEKGQKIPSTVTFDDAAFAQATLLRMEKTELVFNRFGIWDATDRGRESLKRAIAAQDVLRQMEIYNSVTVDRVLAPDEVLQEDQRPNPNLVRWNIFDPRFDPESPTAFDMRLAVITWLADTVVKKPGMDPHTTVFLQKLGSGRINVTAFWSSYERTFAEIEEIVATAYKWTDMAPEDQALASSRMQMLYTAGQIEQQKREGSNCGGCGVPLVFYEKNVREVLGKELSACPCCDRQFPPLDPPGTPGTLSCPKCKAVIYEGEPRCGGCGALVDFSLPSGSSETDTTQVTTTVWTSSYGCVSCGWLDPWDPFVNVVVLDSLYYDPWYYY